MSWSASSPPDAEAGLPVLSKPAREAYEALLHRPDGIAATAFSQLGDEEALAELLRQGLATRDEPRPGWVRAVDPQIVEARLGAALRSAALKLLDQAGELSELLRPLIIETSREQAVPRGGHVTRIEGKAMISAVISETVRQCREELLTAQPGGGRPKATLAAVLAETRMLLDRGVSIRTLYQHTAWHDSDTRGYVTEVTALGAEVRTLDTFFDRLIVVDRRMAFLPADDSRDQAVMIREQAIIRFLVDAFDRSWQRAKPFTGSRRPSQSAEISDSLQETIVQCLIDGESDVATAKRIGLSARAYASHLSRLKRQVDAETRFQLGYRLAKLEDAPPG